MNFISSLCDHKLISKYSKVLDWFLDDQRISLLNANQKTRLIKIIKRYKGFTKDNFMRLPQKDLLSVDVSNFKMFFLFSGSGCEVENFLKHLRNSIAHKHIKMFRHKKSFYVEGFDINRKRKTAIFAMPLSFLNEIFNDYLLVLNKEK